MGLESGFGGGTPYAYSGGHERKPPRSDNGGIFALLSSLINSGAGDRFLPEFMQDIANKRLNPLADKIVGGREGQLLQRNKDGKSFDTSKPEPQKVAPQTVFRPKPKQGGQELSSLDQLFQQLVGSVGQGAVSFDYETALRDSEKAIRDAYRADIGAIRGANRGARKDTAANRREVEAMYEALSRQYEKTSNQAGRQGERRANLMQGRSERSADHLTELAAKLGNEQADLAKGLGIEEAMAGLIPENTEVATRDAGRILKEGAQDANRQLGFADNQQRFLQRGGINAQLEGTNRSANMLSDLQNFLQDNLNNVANLRGQRARELAANKQGVMDSVSEMQMSADNEMWERLMSLAGLKLDMEDTQIDNDFNMAKLEQQAALAAQRGGDKESFIPEYLQKYNEALGAMPKPLRGLMNSITKSDEFSQGRFAAPNGEFIKLNPTAAANAAEEQALAENPNLSAEEIAMIRLAAQVYAQGGV